MGFDVKIGDWDGNYTHNSLGKLCYNHLDKESGLKSLDRKTGREASAMLESFWESIHCEKLHLWQNGIPGEPKLSEKYDSPNGWGSLIGALIFMGELTAACRNYPRRKVSVCA